MAVLSYHLGRERGRTVLTMMNSENPSQDDGPEFLTRREVAALARTSLSRVRYWDRKGLLPRVRPFGTRLVLYPRAEVLAWIRGEWALPGSLKRAAA
jgi:predicted DNA-binding transcriptional regulator AlpA